MTKEPPAVTAWKRKMAELPAQFTVDEIREAIRLHNGYHHVWSSDGLAWDEFLDLLLEAKEKLKAKA